MSKWKEWSKKRKILTVLGATLGTSAVVVSAVVPPVVISHNKDNNIKNHLTVSTRYIVAQIGVSGNQQMSLNLKADKQLVKRIFDTPTEHSKENVVSISFTDEAHKQFFTVDFQVSTSNDGYISCLSSSIDKDLTKLDLTKTFTPVSDATIQLYDKAEDVDTIYALKISNAETFKIQDFSNHNN